MIKYALKCAEGHIFEDWFASSSKFDEQRAEHEITCPTCGSTDITKTVMAPNVSTASAQPTPSCGAPSCANMGCPAMQG